MFLEKFSSLVRAVAVGLALFQLVGCGASTPHGTITSMSVASDADWKACKHDVPEEVCVKCHPELAESFKQRGDWCSEHDVAESQCLKCHPDIDFSPPKDAPKQADIVHLVRDGSDVAALEPHLVKDKVTIFDFHAKWCPPCRKVDEHLFPILAKRADIALRKIDVGSWDTPVAEHWLADVPELPYLIIYDKKGRRVTAISGAQFEKIDRAIEEAEK
jgi:thiol-disulfide isomerase/thioredoxin